MSKQSEAKDTHGYRECPDNCGNCKFLEFDRELKEWMEELNQESSTLGRAARYIVEVHGIDKKFRCGSGGFAVKKTATCNYHRPKEEA